MCAKLHTVAASSNRDHASQSLLLLLVRATHIYCCSSRTSRSWWITHSTQRHRRGCNNYRRSDTSLYSTKSWRRIGSWRQCRWFALKYFFGLYFKYLINLKTLEFWWWNCPVGPPWLRAWWQPYSDCELQTRVGIRDWTKFMCTPIRKFKLTNTIFKNHDNSGYTGNLYTVSTDNPVIMFIFLIYSVFFAEETFATVM